MSNAIKKRRSARKNDKLRPREVLRARPIATPAPGRSGAMQLRLDACNLNDSIYLYLSRTQAKRLVARLAALELSVSR